MKGTKFCGLFLVMILIVAALAACNVESIHEHIANADDGDCTTGVACFLCQEVTTQAKEHTPSANWSKDETDHWKECTNADCTQVVGEESRHTMKNDSSDCEVCFYVDTSIFTIKEGVLSDCNPGAYTSITIPNSVTSIGDMAFSGCSGLTSITIGNSVTSIGNYAFYNCRGLTSTTIGNSVTSIGDSAFSGCRGLTSITIPDSVKSIGDSALFGCSGLTSITIPDSVKSIGDSALFGCSGLTSITIPDSVTSIGESAFSSCSGLTSITIPNSVTRIGEGAFSRCTSLTIYAEAKSQPAGWDSWWNVGNCTVVWGIMLNKQKD